MDIFIKIIIAGFASGYFIELAASLLTRWVSARLVKQVLTLPLSFIALALMGITGASFFVYTPASGFVSLVIMAIVSKPVEVTQVVSRR